MSLLSPVVLQKASEVLAVVDLLVTDLPAALVIRLCDSACLLFFFNAVTKDSIEFTLLRSFNVNL